MKACLECVEMRTALAEEFKTLRPLFAALGDEARQRILLALLESEQVGLRVGEVAARTHLSRPAASRHLRLLRESGAVCVHREGTRSYYYANAGAPCWRALYELSGHICQTVEYAGDVGYPHFEEE